MTALFIVVKWGVPNFIIEIKDGYSGKGLSRVLFSFLLIVSAGVIFFFIVNEIVENITELQSFIEALPLIFLSL